MRLAVAPFESGLFPWTITGIILGLEFRAASRANIDSRVNKGLAIRAQVLNPSLVAAFVAARFVIRRWSRGYLALGFAVSGAFSQWGRRTGSRSRRLAVRRDGIRFDWSGSDVLGRHRLRWVKLVFASRALHLAVERLGGQAQDSFTGWAADRRRHGLFESVSGTGVRME
jgi:hypothetical protein